MKLNKIDLATILWLIAFFSFLALMIFVKFYYLSSLGSIAVWFIVYSSLLIICSSIIGTIIYTTVEPDKIFEINTGLILIFGFLIIWGFFGFNLNATFFIISGIVSAFLLFGWILGKSSSVSSK